MRVVVQGVLPRQPAQPGIGAEERIGQVIVVGRFRRHVHVAPRQQPQQVHRAHHCTPAPKSRNCNNPGWAYRAAMNTSTRAYRRLSTSAAWGRM